VAYSGATTNCWAEAEERHRNEGRVITAKAIQAEKRNLAKVVENRPS